MLSSAALILYSIEGKQGGGNRAVVGKERRKTVREEK
jgi:hypothetical protein